MSFPSLGTQANGQQKPASEFSHHLEGRAEPPWPTPIPVLLVLPHQVVGHHHPTLAKGHASGRGCLLFEGGHSQVGGDSKGRRLDLLDLRDAVKKKRTFMGIMETTR